MNDLIAACVESNKGARIGYVKVCIVGYCDEIFLMSPTGHMRNLLELCDDYVIRWKIEFNAKKSISAEFGKSAYGQVDLYVGGVPIPSTKTVIYLGLSIGSSHDVQKFYD